MRCLFCTRRRRLPSAGRPCCCCLHLQDHAIATPLRHAVSTCCSSMGWQTTDLPFPPSPGTLGKRWGRWWQRYPLPEHTEGTRTYGVCQKVAGRVWTLTLSCQRPREPWRGELRVRAEVAPSPPHQRRRTGAERQHSPGIQQN